MKIDNIKDLEAVLKLCNKQGVRSISIDGISLALDGVPPNKKEETYTNAYEALKPENISEEDLLFWSSQS